MKKVKIRKRSKDAHVKINPALKETDNFDPKQIRKIEKTILALVEKADASGIAFNLLEQVFDRGCDATGTIEGGFDRVNAYIARGKTFYECDADLHEAEKRRKLIKKTPHKRFSDFKAFRDT